MTTRTLTIEITEHSNGAIYAEVKTQEEFGVIERTAAAKAILEGIPQEVLNLQFCDQRPEKKEMTE